MSKISLINNKQCTHCRIQKHTITVICLILDVWQRRLQDQREHLQLFFLSWYHISSISCVLVIVFLILYMLVMQISLEDPAKVIQFQVTCAGISTIDLSPTSCIKVKVYYPFYSLFVQLFKKHLLHLPRNLLQVIKFHFMEFLFNGTFFFPCSSTTCLFHSLSSKQFKWK